MKTRRKAVEILREAEHLRAMIGKDPKSLAAASLYIACLMYRKMQTQETISDAAGVTSVTIRNRYKELKRF